MSDSIKVINKDSQIRIKIKNMLDRYNRLPHLYQSKIGYINLTQNVILKELINIMGTITMDLDIELKLKISRRKCLESRFL